MPIAVFSTCQKQIRKMDREELKWKIYDDLKCGLKPTFNKYWDMINRDRGLYLSVLWELKNAGLIDFDTEKNKQALDYGEPIINSIRIIK